MRVRVQVIVVPDGEDDEQAPIVHEVASIERGDLSVDTLGLQLAEAKDLLQQVQTVVIDPQVRTQVAQQVACPGCGRARAHKDAHTIVVRTLFGTLHLRSPRWHHCSCQPHPTRTFSPLAAVLPKRNTPELLYLESKFAGLVSYAQRAELLAETLPLGRQLHASAVRLHALATGTRLESELGPEQAMFAEGCQAAWDELPRPDLPLTVGLDGGYVHSSRAASHQPLSSGISFSTWIEDCSAATSWSAATRRTSATRSVGTRRGPLASPYLRLTADAVSVTRQHQRAAPAALRLRKSHSRGLLQHAPDLGQQLVHLERLGHVSRRADFFYPAARVLGRTHGDDPKLMAGVACDAGEAPAIEHRHAHVQQHQAWPPPRHDLQRLRSVGGGGEGVALQVQQLRHRAQDGCVVVDHQDRFVTHWSTPGLRRAPGRLPSAGPAGGA
jgi:hypothetical protein